MQNEREALLEFKKGIVDNDGILSSWGNEEDKRDCCRWRGVKCSNRTGHVISLDLQNEEYIFEPLRGKINPSLLDLQHLTYLDLSFNRFGESRIPNFIGSLHSLRYLNLQYNDFFGAIPHQIGNLTNLRSLRLGHYYPSALSVENLEWLSDLRLLRQFEISYVDLGNIDWLQPINKLSFLTELGLTYCGLPGINHSSLLLTNLSSTPLAVLDLSGNSFTSSSTYNWLFNFSSTLVVIYMRHNPLGGPIPDVFGNMISLETLDLSFSSLEGEIPKSFKNLSCLRSLSLFENNLVGQLPDLFQTLIASKNSLETLELRSNEFRGSLPDFTRFSSLKELRLSYNKLQGSFPKSFGQTSPLSILDLFDNELNGSFPHLTSFPLLTHLSLGRNKLKGRLPESIGQLSNLTFLDLSSNLLTLEFSSNWAPLFQLDCVNLCNCKLGPHFPEWLRSQNNIKALDISSAGISDTIPNWFWDLSPRLRYLNISDNQIHGMLPDLSLKFDTSLKFEALLIIDFHSNRFKGPIPLLPHSASTLNLSKNKFTGSIISLCTNVIKFLRYLDLSNNRLSSEVPDCWISASRLQILDLANNNFSGRIPSSFGFLNMLQLLSLRNNNFIGELPSSLNKCTRLEVVDMSKNKLSGKIPAWIGTHLRRLTVLSFRRNELGGNIPPSICSLNSIQVLDLSQNKISGNIPQCFNKLYSLIQTKNSNATTYFGDETQEFTYFDEQTFSVYMAAALVQWKGKVLEYRRTLGLLKCIDLSSNKLVGKIPQELASLTGLISLNLSRNNLKGKIIQEIGQIEKLEVLDLSENQLSGEIPMGLASLNFLCVLDLSSNNFSGKIPSSTQLQSFDGSVYAGNRELCGPPLPNKCAGEDESASLLPSTNHGKDKTNEEDDDRLVTIGFYVSVVLGFTIGFWGFFIPLLLRSSWRDAYLKLLDKIKDWIYVTAAVNMARLQRKVWG
ncbi:hypothetical protein LguiA_026533 [Lonicera macranthoides]